MVDYPDLGNLSSGAGISSILSLPNASYPIFWTLILGGIWLIVTLTLYFREKSLKGIGNLLSSAGVSALACVVLLTLGSIVGIFTVETQVPIATFCVIIIAVWLFSSSR